MSIPTKSLTMILLSLTFFGLSPVFCLDANVPLYNVQVSGEVMDYNANLIAGAEVHLFEIHYAYAEGRFFWESLGNVVTDNIGHYSLETKVMNLENIWAIAYKEGLALGYEYVHSAGANLNQLIIILDIPDTLKGVVLDENRKPISNAKLSFCITSDRSGGRDIAIPSLQNIFSTKSDINGNFSFNIIPEGATADILVEVPGKIKTWTYTENDKMAGMKFQAGTENIEIVLNNESRIEGKVIDTDTGNGISGVTLLARADKRLSNYYNNYSTVSGQDGSFQITGLPPDDYSIQVVALYDKMPEWVGKDIKVTVEQEQTVKNIEVPVNKGSTIKFTIKDAVTNELLKEAYVNITQKASFGRHPCYYKSTYSDENGIAIFRAPEGEYEISAGGDFYIFLEEPEPINVVKGQTHNREIFLDNQSAISGIVTDEQGNPAKNVQISTKPVCEQIASSNAKGEFNVRWYLHPRYNSSKWFLMAQDLENNRTALVEVTEATKTKNITLEPAKILSGKITDPNGKAIPLAAVKLTGDMPGWRTTAGNRVYTNKNGHYELKAIPSSQDNFILNLEVSAKGYGPIGNIRIDNESDTNEIIEIDPIVLQPTDQSISGIVLDANEQPVSGLELFIGGLRGNSNAGQPERRSVTDENGKFFIDGLCKGPLRIQAGAGGTTFEPGFMDAEGGDKNIKVILGQRLTHIPYESLINKSIPSMSDLGIELDKEKTENTTILVCFFDIEQRPSRNTILQLNKKTTELKEKDIEIIAVHASTIEQNTIDEWVKENDISFPIGVIEENTEQTRFNWGVKALPWLILSDKEHIVTAEGFSVSELDDIITK